MLRDSPGGHASGVLLDHHRLRFLSWDMTLEGTICPSAAPSLLGFRDPGPWVECRGGVVGVVQGPRGCPGNARILEWSQLLKGAMNAFWSCRIHLRKIKPCPVSLSKPSSQTQQLGATFSELLFLLTKTSLGSLGLIFTHFIPHPKPLGSQP